MVNLLVAKLPSSQGVGAPLSLSDRVLLLLGQSHDLDTRAPRDSLRWLGEGTQKVIGGAENRGCSDAAVVKEKHKSKKKPLARVMLKNPKTTVPFVAFVPRAQELSMDVM